MATDAELLERSGDLKRELVEYATSRRFRRAYEAALHQQFGLAGPPSDQRLIDFLDSFMLEHRLPDGRTVVEHFVESRPRLSAAEREMLLGWRDVVEGLFVIEERRGDALVLGNLIDELTYVVRSNIGPAALRPMTVGSFIYTRIVPFGEEWMLSGYQRLFGAEKRETIHQVAAEMAMRAPRLVFRNPRLLEIAWEFQRAEHEAFTSFFGDELVILPGAEVPERIRAFMRYLTSEYRDAEGRTAAERASGVTPSGPAPEPAEVAYPDFLIAAETVGVIHDEIDGLNLFPNFGPVAETFAHPERAADPSHAGAVRDYLENPEIIPLPLRLLAERQPANARRVFQQVLRRPGFSWERDGEQLLRVAKPDYYASPVLPGVRPFGDRLAEANQSRPAPAPAGARQRATPVPRRTRPVRRRRR